ncbi:MAG: hypothetical protein OES32_19605 [Acidobacteriota bacterium]|nr:hypothetical protein [Acidobacteriota bacterium]MDH3525783.1 hypothetical protein [Acidobacteriota bacterium]
MRLIPFVLLALMLLTAATLRSQEDLQVRLFEQLDDLNEDFCRDLKLTHLEAEDPALDQDESTLLQVDLDDEAVYTIIGICDADCLDLDLYLLDADGNDLDEDTQTDAQPAIEIKGPGSFLLDVYMVDCRAEPCYFAVGLLQGPCLSG